ncbi:hypothetical protein KIL84_016362 [Mauremys mutica]|uniref:Reverse transcriptase n=1 Tax=Mauremys mutica TaxID=74926 RepID=A0A9D3X431_9SAUR|nr:hypothetical protein KIL84_016362 [Mauremys mutica]
MLERTLNDDIRCQYVENLKRMPDQDKAFEGLAQLHSIEWSCQPQECRDKRCRKCGYANETLPHVLCSCKPHSRAWQLQHNAIQDCLARAIPPPIKKVAMNSTIPGTNSQLQPDIVITNEDRKKIILVDVTVSFENRTLAFHDAQAQKVEKYDPLAKTLRARSYQISATKRTRELNNTALKDNGLKL